MREKLELLETELNGLNLRTKNLRKQKELTKDLELELEMVTRRYKNLRETLLGKSIEADNLKQLSSEISNNRHLLQ